MLILNLLSIRNAAAGSGGRLRLASLVFRNNETRVLANFRSFQQSCWFCRRVWALSSGPAGRRRRTFGQSRVQALTSPQSLVQSANYCAVRSSSDANDSSNKQLPTENIFTIPNALSVIRIGMTPFIGNMIVHGQYGPAIGLLTVAGITDLLDGWIARVYPSQSSKIGSFLDPLADKILVGTLFLSLTYNNLIPVPLTVLIVGRDAILIAFGFYIRYQSLDPPRTLRTYFNAALPTAQLAPTFISKMNTGLQLSVVGATLLSTVISSMDLQPYLPVLWYTTGATTIASAVWYCFAKDTVKLFRQTSSRMKMRAKNKQQ